MSEHGASGCACSPRSARSRSASAAVVIVAVLAHRTPGPAGATNTPAPSTGRRDGATPSRFPAPPPDAVVFSRPDGHDVLALGRRPRAGSSACRHPSSAARAKASAA